ncbi:MAG: DNA translocase FtsK [Planctomycetota bacterium]|nr:DNA translocase FtsK [Planctomycetota bacterium]
MRIHNKTAGTGPSRLSGGVAVAAGVVLIGLGAFLFLSLLTADIGLDLRTAAKKSWTGLAGAWMAYGCANTMGQNAAIILSLLLASWGLHVALSTRFLSTWPRVFGGVLILVAAAFGYSAAANRYDMETGGLLAIYASPPALLYFGRWGLLAVALGAMFIGILLAFGETAVLAVRQSFFSLRDACLGLISLAPRLWHLLRLLFSSRLALAGGPVANPDPSSQADSTFPDVGTAEAVSEAEAAREKPAVDPQIQRSAGQAERKPARIWQIRDHFTSSFIHPDGENPADATPGISEPLQTAVPPTMEPYASRQDEVLTIPVPNWQAEPETAMAADAPPAPNRPGTVPAACKPAPDPIEDCGKATASLAEAAIRPENIPQPAQTAKSTPVPAYPAPPPQPAAPKPEVAISAFADAADRLKNYSLPTLDLLDPPEPPIIEDRAKSEAKAKMLEQTLGEFKIDGRVVHIERGPRVTLYELSLAPGIRLNKVTSLADNLAMQLQAESIRIIAPIPGKNTIGIEIPNAAKELVSLREIVGSINREKRRQALPICLGKDVSGLALVADLTRMPHLLIAGATGSGKSVCINSIILSVMTCCRPDEAQLIMVDPKVVELSRFKDIPHLMCPVITDMKRAVAVLEWICQKMDERYEQMSQVSVNNIAKFNALGEEGIRTRLDAFASLEEIEAFPKKMPYMVVIIDELADLMMVAGKEVEQHITRLAAKSRAVGIHLILATQRPSVDVITGLIKANMPCRIAFQVASRVDSRTILDQNGAETLLGQGDMLYLPPGVGKLTRAQGVFVSDEELFRVVDFTKSEAGPQYHPDLLGPVIGGGGGSVDISSFDELFLESGETIIENQRGSVSLLQRKFGIGYGRASRIIDQLAAAGLLGPFRDGKAREILLTQEEFSLKFGGAPGRRDGCDDGDDGRADSLAGQRADERGPEPAPWEDDEEEE